MKKNYLYNLLLSLINILFPVVTFPYASHILGPDGIGKVQFSISLAQYFGMFAALGIPAYGVIEIARNRADPLKLSKVFSELTVIYLLSSLFFAAIYFSIILLIPFFAADRNIYIIAGLIIVLGFTTLDWFYFGLEEFRLIALRSALIKIISVICLYVLVKNLRDYNIYLSIIIFSALGNNLISVMLVSKHVKFSWKGLMLKRYIKPLFFILGTSLAASIYTVLDTVLLGFLSDDHAVGLYTAAVKLCKISIPFITSMGMTVIPKVSEYHQHNNYQELKLLLDKSYAFTIIFAIPVTAGLILLAPELIGLFSGRSFIPATFSMQILSVLPLLIGLGHLFGMQILVPFGYNKQMFLSTMGGVICCLLFNILLVPYFNIEGAAIANVLCELCVTSLYIFFTKKYYQGNFRFRPVVQAIVCSLIFVPGIILIKNCRMGELYTILISVPLCALIYFLSQMIIFRDSMVRNLVFNTMAKLKPS